MALFGKLFEKKYCDICGGEIGLLGNRKLEDGNLCKNCAGKLSPFFSERRHSTVASIKEQLEYREENKKAVSQFQVTRTLGRNTKVLIDENAGKFVVTNARNLVEANPDVIDLSQVTGCDFDIQENHYEETRTVKKPDGTTKQVSYNPPHYEYKYDFKITIYVNHPYFDEIKFDLNTFNVSIKTVGLMGSRPMDHSRSLKSSIGGAILQGVMDAVSETTGYNNDPRMANPDYYEYYNLGYEIKNALTQARDQIREQKIEAAMPKKAVTCPYCGATTFPDANGCCEYCGGSLNS